MVVELTYFKKGTGKYYSKSIYHTDETDMEDIYYDVSRKLKNGKLPGLSVGATDFIVLVNVPDHVYNTMKLIGLSSENGSISIGGSSHGSTIVSGNGNTVNS